MTTQTLAARILAIRTAAGLSQEAAAKRAGMRQNHWSVIERGADDVRASTLRKVAKGLGCTVAKLLGERP